MESYSVIDFEAQDSIVAEGTRAARMQWETLKEVASQQAAEIARPPIPKAVDSLTINRLIIRGNSSYSRGFVKGKLRFDLSEKIAFKDFQEGIVNLAATDNFSTIRYELISNGLGEDLILYLQEDPIQSFIRFGLHYDDLYKTAGLVNYTKKKLFTNDDLASLDLILGDHIRYKAKYFVDKGSYWSFGINSRYNSFDEEINYSLIQQNFDTRSNPDINVINLDVSDLTNQIYMQTVLREEFAFSLGLEHKLLKYSTRTLNQLPEVEGDLTLQNSDERTYFENSNYFSVFGKLTLDTYNDKYFPTRGLYFDGVFNLYLFSSDFNDNFSEFSIGKARMGAAFPLWSKVSLNLETEGGFKLGVSSVTSLDFILGGFGAEMINNFVPFLGYDFLSLPGNSFVKAHGRVDWEFARKNHLLFSVNYANVEDDLFRTGEWFTAPDYSGYGIGYGWASFFGPVQFVYSWSPEARNNAFFFSIGYWF
jgi:NTE family protein